jgi:hypothetical protein
MFGLGCGAGMCGVCRGKVVAVVGVFGLYQIVIKLA